MICIVERGRGVEQDSEWNREGVSAQREGAREAASVQARTRRPAQRFPDTQRQQGTSVQAALPVTCQRL